ncbi:GltB/FmdC/FwdC-like GXGXG domain-containing protein, partial [Pseudomonas aeruginosa]
LAGGSGGNLFAAGTTGDRFAVRRSGSLAAVEGTADHSFESVTGGVFRVLGKSGNHFGTGMTRGLAYVLDMENRLSGRI